MKSFGIVLVLLLFFVLNPFKRAFCTHIKAADMYAQVNPLNSNESNAYRIIRFTLTMYALKESVDDNPNSGGIPCEQMLGNCATLSFGDGSEDVQNAYISKTDIGNETYEFVYVFEHKYPADGFYIASYRDVNRNDAVLNINNGSSQDEAFYIEIGLDINNANGRNRTPKMTIPPIDYGTQFQKYIHNPGAYDQDGDSISYKLLVPRKNKNPPLDVVLNYVFPNQIGNGTTQDQTGPAQFFMEATSGNLVWDAPDVDGLYNAAFMIEEWRRFGRFRQRISYTVRDMQIDIEPGQNRPPVVFVPADTCISAEKLYSVPIRATDPDRNEVFFTAYGELFDSPNINPKASFTPFTNPLATPAAKIFSWRPGCGDVRRRPYQAFFKATDKLPPEITPPLADIKEYLLTVVAPSPTGLVAVENGKQIQLNWNPYACTASDILIDVFRKVGCDTLRLEGCRTGAPSSYEYIGTVPVSQTSYLDHTPKRGVQYSYILVARLRDQVGLSTNSYPSRAACITLPVAVPVITRVSVNVIDNRQIFISWIKPPDLDTLLFTGPYTYRLLRSANTGIYKPIAAFGPFDKLVGGEYIDSGNTTDSIYSYSVEITYFRNGVSIADTSETASEVFLKTAPINRGIQLTWTAATPWSNRISTIYHYIWRKKQNQVIFTKIDSVLFTTSNSLFSYNDQGTYQNQPFRLGDSASYYVTTGGSYQNIRIPSPLYNNSQIATNIPLDIVPPCAPTLQSIAYDCDNFDLLAPYTNKLQWLNQPYSEKCDSDLVAYKVYFSLEEESAYSVLNTITDKNILTYNHSGLLSVAGCYAVTALDAAGNESVKSNRVCIENCFNYQLPNVFTPNNSGVNDLFRPIPPAPLFVESVDFTVVNRWGKKVFHTNDIYLNWDGSNLPDGMYFYHAKINFFSLDPAKKEKELKGWVQIIR